MRTFPLAVVLAGLVAACAGSVPPPARHPTPPRSSEPTVAAQAAVTSPAAWLLGHDWERIPTRKHVVALTFDAGGDGAGVHAIRQTLASRHVPATFFLTGSWVRAHPAKAHRIAATYRVGNHSLDHPHFPSLTNRQIRSQIRRAATAISEICGVSPAPLFRFPFGDRDARTIDAVNGIGYIPVRWTVDTLGWKGTSGGQSVRSVVRRVLAGLRPGEIVLMHVGAHPSDHSTLDADALPRVISALRARGYGFVTLDALLNAKS
jgi:peptidoglycan/xylan/chitin deacetylase (PgdA/CDA1 family)